MKLTDRTKYYIKYFLAGILYYTGLLFFIRAIKLKNRATVLMYHRVLTENEKQDSFSHPGIIVNTTTFAKQVAFLKKMFHVISEDEFLSHITQEIPFKKNTCLITFDDGWMDNFTHAYPVLSNFQLPATIFLTTNYIGTGETFWQEKLSAELYRLALSGDAESKARLKPYALEKLSNMVPTHAREAIREFITQLKNKPSDEIQTITKHFFNENGYAPAGLNDIDNFFNWDHVRKMAQNGISFGSHSVHHHILTNISLEEAGREMEASRKAITDHIGIPPKSFCYPNGNYSDEITLLVGDAGYLAAFSTATGHIDQTRDRYALPRINIHDEVTNTIPLFMARILGLF